VGARVRLVVSPSDAAPYVTFRVDGSELHHGDEVVLPFGVHQLQALSSSDEWVFDSWNDGQSFDEIWDVEILTDGEFYANFSRV
jgi:uncharacterized protein YjlB